MSAYKNAKDVLPDDLLEAVQRYLQGETLYIPVKGSRRPWGERTGAKKDLAERNQAIREPLSKGPVAGGPRLHVSLERGDGPKDRPRAPAKIDLIVFATFFRRMTLCYTLQCDVAIP